MTSHLVDHSSHSHLKKYEGNASFRPHYVHNLDFAYCTFSGTCSTDCGSSGSGVVPRFHLLGRKEKETKDLLMGMADR